MIIATVNMHTNKINKLIAENNFLFFITPDIKKQVSIKYNISSKEIVHRDPLTPCKKNPGSVKTPGSPVLILRPVKVYKYFQVSPLLKYFAKLSCLKTGLQETR